jgi:hypothetical protein
MTTGSAYRLILVAKNFPKTSDTWFAYLKKGVFEQAQPVFG